MKSAVGVAIAHSQLEMSVTAFWNKEENGLEQHILAFWLSSADMFNAD